jgi:plastocyanin
MRRKLAPTLAALAALTALVVATTGQAAPAAKLKLSGTDGPGFTITMSKKSVKAGTYDITINDRSAIHNFHLTGPGVNKATGVGAMGSVVWKNLKLKKGTYRFVCDPHAGNMKGTLKVT